MDSGRAWLERAGVFAAIRTCLSRFLSHFMENDIRIVPMQLAHVEALAALQMLVFPTLSAAERMQAQHYRKHLELFPEGQMVALTSANEVVGMTSTIRHRWTDAAHTFLEAAQGLWLTSHDPAGDWLYGMDMGVHPVYRGQGIARKMYWARQHLCQLLGLQGQMTVGMLNGYATYAATMSVEDYYEAVRQGQVFDPTVSVQQRLGFKIMRFMPHYLDDPQCGHAGALMCWRLT